VRELERELATVQEAAQRLGITESAVREPLEEERESPQTVEEESERAEPQSATARAQEGIQRRSWWRRWFGSPHE
jgi:predicted transcriptional regulator